VNRAGVQAEELALCLTMSATEGAGQPVRAHVATFQDRTEDRPTFDAGGLQPSPERLNRHTIPEWDGDKAPMTLVGFTAPNGDKDAVWTSAISQLTRAAQRPAR
jgi:hypothetical protein